MTLNKRFKRREPWAKHAHRLGVSQRTLDRWVERGIIERPEYVNRRKYGNADAAPRLDATRPVSPRLPARDSESCAAEE